MTDIPLSEKAFMQQILMLAKLTHWHAYHTFDSRRSQPGFPDLTLVKPGAPVIFAEIKSHNGRVSEAQAAWLERLSQTTGVQSCLWRPDNWEGIVTLLQQAAHTRS